MCTTVSINKPKTVVKKKFKAELAKPDLFKPSYRIDAFAKENLHIIKMDEPTKIYPASWGLVPSIAANEKDNFLKNYATYNARRESLFSSPIFSKSIFDKRCVIIADGFYEPHHTIDNVQAYYAYIPNDAYKDQRDLFVFAGVYTELAPNEYTATIITAPSDPFFSFIHNKKKRMPWILEEELIHEWLLELNEAQIKDLLHTGFTSKEFYAYPITKQFYKDRTLDSSKVIEPTGKIIQQSDESFTDELPIQGSLF